MDDSRWIWRYDQRSGPFTVAQLTRLARDGEINHRTLFWSERRAEWLPLRGLLFDLFPGQLVDMRRVGIQRMRVLGSGLDSDCAACKRLADQVYPISKPPVLPPRRCTCNPWCRCTIVAA
jgi:GYF domain 2